MVCRLRRQFDCNQRAVARCLYVPKTHERYVFPPETVFNQSPPLENYNLFDGDCALKETVRREGGG